MTLDPEALELLRRDSGLGLTADGVFTYRSAPLENPRVQTLFHRGLAVRDDGEVTLHVGRMWAYVEAEGVTRFVRALRVDGERVTASLLGDEERDASAMRLVYAEGDGRFYAWLDAQPRPARLLRDAHQTIAGALEEGPAVKLGGRRVPVVTLAAPPAPDDPRPA